MAFPSSIAAVPHRLPLLGHMVSLLRDPLAFLSSLPVHGDLVRVGLGPVTAVAVAVGAPERNSVLRSSGITVCPSSQAMLSDSMAARIGCTELASGHHSSRLPTAVIPDSLRAGRSSTRDPRSAAARSRLSETVLREQRGCNCNFIWSLHLSLSRTSCADTATCCARSGCGRAEFAR
ncbi:hypothetical protein [Nocardia tengchongensis]|uniref:hypothetical protein n=1 Tax=Nocardia tengchongensis TaxID=2055889 RepID=UPI0036629C0D